LACHLLPEKVAMPFIHMGVIGSNDDTVALPFSNMKLIGSNDNSNYP
jgi:hypothetical protein